MKQQFEVIKIESKTMLLRRNSDSGCSSCNANNGCGIRLLGDYFQRNLELQIPRKNGAVIGDLIDLEMPTKTLFRRAFGLYILPLLALFAGGFIGGALLPHNELWQIIFALLSFTGVFLLNRFGISTQS